MRDLVIIGASGHGRELLDVVEAINAQEPTWRVLGFLDDGAPDLERLRRRGVEHLGRVEALLDLDAHYVIGIGDNDIRARIDAQATHAGRAAATLVHPLASIGADVELGPGVVVTAGARITTNVRVGRHSHLNINAVVSHDCRVGAHVTLSPGVLVNGTVTVHDRVLLGTGAIVLPGCTVGEDSWVGAGSVVLDDLPAHIVASGVPALVRRSR